MGLATWLVIILCVAMVIAFVVYFNKIARASNNNREAFRNVDIILKKRFDLISNVENIIKKYTSEGKDNIENLAMIRESLSNKMTVDSRRIEEDKYSEIIKDMVNSVGNYPEIKESIEFQEFRRTLNEIEGEIEVARRHYNDTTREYNKMIEEFPTSLFAKVFGFEKRSYFEVDLLSREDVQINFVDRRNEPR